MLSGKGVNCEGKSQCFVGNTKQAEELDSFFSNEGRSSAKIGKNLRKNITRDYGGTLDFRASFGKYAVSKNVKAALSTIPEVITF